jgi:hypothetical protein
VFLEPGDVVGVDGRVETNKSREIGGSTSFAGVPDWSIASGSGIGWDQLLYWQNTWRSYGSCRFVNAEGY